VVFIGPDVAVDGFVTDVELAVESEPAGDLLRAPVFAQQSPDLCPLCGSKTAVSPGLGSPAVGVPVCELWPVSAIVVGRITSYLSANGAPVATQDARDGRGSKSLSSEQPEGVTFFVGDLAILHHDLLVLGRDKKVTVSQITVKSTACCT
jgi:hypothetical protein